MTQENKSADIREQARQLKICAECGHGVALHEWEDENHSSCLASATGQFGTKHANPCMCSGYKEKPAALSLTPPASQSIDEFWDEWERSDTGHQAIMRDAGSEIRSAEYLPKIFAEAYHVMRSPAPASPALPSPAPVEKFWNSVVTDSAYPRCPKCWYARIKFGVWRYSLDEEKDAWMECEACGYKVRILTLESLREFFPSPAPASQGFLQSRCPHLWEKFNALERLMLTQGMSGPVQAAMGVLWNEMLNFKAELAQINPAAASPAPQASLQTRFAEFDDAEHPANIWWQKHGQYHMSGGGRREFIWACRGWIAREQLYEGVDVTGDSLTEAAIRDKSSAAPAASSHSGEIASQLREMNVNDQVWVKLTPRGEKLYAESWALTHPEGVPPECRHDDAEGSTRFHLWELMSVFHSAMHMGSFPMPFEGNSIWIEAPAPSGETAAEPDYHAQLLKVHADLHIRPKDEESNDYTTAELIANLAHAVVMARQNFASEERKRKAAEKLALPAADTWVRCERDEAKKCAELICECCGKYAETWNAAVLERGKWMHHSKTRSGHFSTNRCSAGAIYERIATFKPLTPSPSRTPQGKD